VDASAAGPNSTILISRPTGLGALPETGENSGVAGRGGMSGDGRFVVFTSGADDLGVRDTHIHVWVRDTVSGTTTLVDRLPGGGAAGDGNAFGAAISRDGGTVCFLGTATNLVAGITGTHVFAVTLATGAIVVADRANGAAGAVANGTPFRCALDATGLRLAFDSDANNLVPLDNNFTFDVFVRHLAADATERVSVDSNEIELSEAALFPTINADGTRIAFQTSAALAGDTNGFTDVYVRDRVAGTTVRASVGTGGVQGNGTSAEAAIDDAGTHVAFASTATTLDLGGDGNGVADVFWRDLVSDTTILVSRATGGAGALGDGQSIGAAISGDGLGVAFESSAGNLGAGTPPASGKWIYLRRLGTNVTSLLSRATGAAGDAANASANGASLGTAPTVVTWGSRASNLDPDASGEFFQVFKRDVSTTTLVSRPTGTGPRAATVNDSAAGGPRAISADGRFVVFTSEADGLDPAAAGIVRHVFVRDTLENTTTLVSRGAGPAGVPADGRSEVCAIAANGTHVAFVSRATNLLAGVTDVQVYVRDLTTARSRWRAAPAHRATRPPWTSTRSSSRMSAPTVVGWFSSPSIRWYLPTRTPAATCTCATSSRERRRS
jgi:Tol biopolymer transport system component